MVVYILNIMYMLNEGEFLKLLVLFQFFMVECYIIFLIEVVVFYLWFLVLIIGYVQIINYCYKS